ncbi:MAG: hypothetical protein CMB11_00040 [Euryarchaeota archaeon]|nr:hypothetical protein [Euryarchaeota archaeon]
MSKRKTREEYLEEARIDERLIKSIAVDSRVVISEGKTGEERIVRVVHGNGAVYHYTGEKNHESLVRVDAYAESSGFKRVCHYKGPKDHEVLWLVEHSNGHVTHYEGTRHEEYKKKVVFQSGNTLYFKGPRKKERKHKQVDRDGTVTFFRGEQGHEYYWAVLHPSGEYHHYRGPKGREKLFRVMDTEGSVTAYDTSMASPKPYRQWSWNGELVHYTDANPLADVKSRHEELRASISTALERAEKLHEDGECKENCYLAISNQLGKIHEAAGALFRAAKSGHIAREPLPSEQLVDIAWEDHDASELSESGE